MMKKRKGYIPKRKKDCYIATERNERYNELLDSIADKKALKQLIDENGEVA